MEKDIMKITIQELAIACYLYAKFTKDDVSYRQLCDLIKGSLNLSEPEHRNALIEWLRRWGCRQFVRSYTELASQELMQWYSNYEKRLFPQDTFLWKTKSDELNEEIPQLFDSLMKLTVSFRQNGNKESPVRVGLTGAAKILFALRPNFFAPWDDPIRRKLRLKTYVEYLEVVKSKLFELEKECNAVGFDLAELPGRLNREVSSVPKLVDEYYWVTITKKCNAVDLIKIIQTKPLFHPISGI